MIIILYYLFVYGMSYFIVNEDVLDPLKDKILNISTIHPLIYKFFDRVLNCLGCMCFWVGWISQIFLFGSFIPLYAFSCYGLVYFIEKLK